MVDWIVSIDLLVVVILAHSIDKESRILTAPLSSAIGFLDIKAVEL